MQKEKVSRNPWPILIRSLLPCSNDWKQSRWRSLSTIGCSWRWRSHLSVRKDTSCNTQKLWLQSELTIQDKVGLQHQEETWNCVFVVKPNDKTSDTNDDVTTKTNTAHMKRDTWQVNVHVVFLLVRVGLHTHSLHTTSRGSSPCVCTHLIHAWRSVTLRLWALHFFQLPTLLILFQSPAAPTALLLPRG